MINNVNLRLLTPALAMMLIFTLAAGSGYPQTRQADNNPDNRSRTDTVLLNVTVTDSQDRFIRDLTKEDFSVLDKDSVQDIVSFSFQDVPVSVGLILDSSNSMIRRGTQLEYVLRENILRFIVHNHQANDYFILNFSEKPKLVLDWTSDRAAIGDAIENNYAPEGGTAFFDACYIAIEKVRQGKHPKRALLLVSDGQANYSTYSHQELRQLVKETDVIIYAIGILDRYEDSLTGYGRSVLKELSSISGGRAFFPQTAGEFAQAVIKISVELRNQYAVGIKAASDGRWHELKVRLNRKGNAKPRDVVIRSRSGYLATRSKS